MTDPEELLGSPTYWRASMMMPRFLFLDARVIAAFLLLVLHLRVWTFAVLLATALVLWLVERRGYRFPNALRALRSALAGRTRPALPSARYRRKRDFGFEAHPLTQHRMAKLEARLARSTQRREQASAAQQNVGPTGRSATAPAPTPT